MQHHTCTASQQATPSTHSVFQGKPNVLPPIVRFKQQWMSECVCLCVFWKSSMKMNSNNHEKVENKTNKGNEFWSVNENSLRMSSYKQEKNKYSVYVHSCLSGSLCRKSVCAFDIIPHFKNYIRRTFTPGGNSSS